MSREAPVLRAPSPRAFTRAIGLCVVLACVAYLVRLHDTPIAIGGDEAFFANHGYAIATTGRDLNGRMLPLVIQLDPDTDPGLWYQAMLVYLEAAAFTVLPFAEWSARLPVALLAIVNVAGLAIVASRYGAAGPAALIAALVLAVSPIHFFLSRQALDYLCPIVFVLAWLYVLAGVHERPRPGSAFVCGVILGAGLFSYVSSWLMMPVYLLCTVALCLTRPDRWRLSVAAVAGFTLPAAALLLWLQAHPEAWVSVVNRYAGAGVKDLPGLNVNTYYRIVDLVAAYWSSFNPAQLFLVGSPNPTIGVRTAGVFVAPVAVLFGAGLWSMRPRALDVILVAGLLSSPLGPMLYGTPGAIQRQLVLLPFVALISARGAKFLWTSPARLARIAATLAVIASPLLFAYVVYGTFEDRESYAVRFDPSNFRELTPALAALNRQIDAPQVVLAIGPYDRRAYWRFHTQKLGDEALRDKALFWEPANFRADAVHANSLIVASAPSPLAEQLDRACRRVAQFRGEAEVVVWRADADGCPGGR